MELYWLVESLQMAVRLWTAPPSKVSQQSETTSLIVRLEVVDVRFDLFAVCDFADPHGRPLIGNQANNVRGNDRIIDSPAPAFAAAEVRLALAYS